MSNRYSNSEYKSLCESRLRRLKALTGNDYVIFNQRIEIPGDDGAYSNRSTTGGRYSTRLDLIEALDAMIYGAETMQAKETP